MVTYGEWRDDSVPFWQNVGIRTTDFTGTTYWSEAYGDPDDWSGAARGAWLGEGSLSGPHVIVGRPEIAFNAGSGTIQSLVSWTQSWITLTRQDSLVTAGTLPASVGYKIGKTYYFTDPNVTGVEWEQTPAPQAQRMTVQLGTMTDKPHANEIQIGMPLRFVTIGGTTAGFVTAPAIRAFGAAATLTVTDPDVMPAATYPLAADHDGSMDATIVDDWTWTQMAPPTSGFLKVACPFRTTWEGEYAPRYRLIYGIKSPRKAAPLRLTQRGDGLTGGAPRLLGRKSRQSNNRMLGGFY